jgi:hypothetical protein
MLSMVQNSERAQYPELGRSLERRYSRSVEVEGRTPVAVGDAGPPDGAGVDGAGEPTDEGDGTAGLGDAGEGDPSAGDPGAVDCRGMMVLRGPVVRRAG